MGGGGLRYGGRGGKGWTAWEEGSGLEVVALVVRSRASGEESSVNQRTAIPWSEIWIDSPAQSVVKRFSVKVKAKV